MTVKRFISLLIPAATVATAMVIAVTPAYAGITSGARAGGVAAPAAHSVLPQSRSATPGGSVPSTSTVTTGAPTVQDISATTTCYHNFWRQETVHVLGSTIWARMTTSWCFNGNKVTSHSTKITEGHSVGWVYYPAPIKFNCYVAHGTTACSGNHENNSPGWIIGGTSSGSSCGVTLDQWETYLGNSHSSSSHFCIIL